MRWAPAGLSPPKKKKGSLVRKAYLLTYLPGYVGRWVCNSCSGLCYYYVAGFQYNCWGKSSVCSWICGIMIAICLQQLIHHTHVHTHTRTHPRRWWAFLICVKLEIGMHIDSPVWKKVYTTARASLEGGRVGMGRGGGLAGMVSDPMVTTELTRKCPILPLPLSGVPFWHARNLKKKKKTPICFLEIEKLKKNWRKNMPFLPIFFTTLKTTTTTTDIDVLFVSLMHSARLGPNPHSPPPPHGNRRNQGWEGGKGWGGRMSSINCLE